MRKIREIDEQQAERSEDEVQFYNRKRSEEEEKLSELEKEDEIPLSHLQKQLRKSQRLSQIYLSSKD